MTKKLIKIIFYTFFFAELASLYSCKNDNPIVNPIDTNDYRVTAIDIGPSWSPDGNSIAYGVSNSIDGNKIQAIDTNSLNKRIIAPVFGNTISWSHDGQWLLFERDGTIFKKRVGGDSATVQLTFRGSSFYPAWSRDDQWIAFDCNFESPTGGYFIWKMKADGSEQKRIIGTDTSGSVRQPDWFPDGIRLLVSRYVGHGNPEIAIIDTAGNSISVLTNDRDFDDGAKISFDGMYITWYKYLNVNRIYVMKVDGTDRQQICFNCGHPNWSPDGKMITFTNETFNDGRIWVMNKDGSNRKKISF